MREIGSEFWLNIECFDNNKLVELDEPNWLKIGTDRKLLFSGRTAINYVLNDIIKKVKKVYMPSYCCFSMLKPFLDNKIEIDFYNVLLDRNGLQYDIDYNNDYDVFFANSYFGFSDSNMDIFIQKFKEKGVIVIEDITHRLLCNLKGSPHSDYYVASLRKWFPIPSGGIAIKNNELFSPQILMNSEKIVEKKINAMYSKYKYINSASNDLEMKNQFLTKFIQFNSSIKECYKDLKIDRLSKKILYLININDVIKKRLLNAMYLDEQLKNFEMINPLFKTININEDCPLFYPIIIGDDYRDDLKNHLIKKNIFCPTHWPISNIDRLNSRTIEIYNKCLSLVCDQRYEIDNMNVIVKEIGEFFKVIC